MHSKSLFHMIMIDLPVEPIIKPSKGKCNQLLLSYNNSLIKCDQNKSSFTVLTGITKKYPLLYILIYVDCWLHNLIHRTYVISRPWQSQGMVYQHHCNLLSNTSPHLPSWRSQAQAIRDYATSHN